MPINCHACGAPNLFIDPLCRPTVMPGSDHCFRMCRQFLRPSVPTFQKKTNFKWELWSLLAGLWVWPSGSLMTPVLFYITSLPQKFWPAFGTIYPSYATTCMVDQKNGWGLGWDWSDRHFSIERVVLPKLFISLVYTITSKNGPVINSCSFSLTVEYVFILHICTWKRLMTLSTGVGRSIYTKL